MKRDAFASAAGSRVGMLSECCAHELFLFSFPSYRRWGLDLLSAKHVRAALHVRVGVGKTGTGF